MIQSFYCRPGFIALKLCPELQFIKNDFVKYAHYAAQIREIFAEYDINYGAVSLDEAYLDVTDYIHTNQSQYTIDNYDSTIVPLPTYLPVLHVDAGKSNFWSPDNTANSNTTSTEQDHIPMSNQSAVVAYRVASEIRQKIYHKTGLTASAGIGCNKMLSKVASDYNKPFAQMLIPNDQSTILSFMSQLNIRKIPGIGKVMERVLYEIVGASKCSDVLLPSNALIIYNLFSHDTATWIISHCLGISSNRHDTNQQNKRKSISCERTFNEINKYSDIKQKCVDIALTLSEDIYDHNVSGKCITLKLKTTLFNVIQRSLTLPRYIAQYNDIRKYALQLLQQEYDKLKLIHQSTNQSMKEPILRLRLMGIRLSSLKDSTSDNNTLDQFIQHNIDNDDNVIHNNDSCSSNTIINNESSVHSMKSIDTDVSPSQCPLCNRTFDINTNQYTINQHIDKCLTIPQGWLKNSSTAATRSIPIPINKTSIQSNTLHGCACSMYGINTDSISNNNISHVTTNNNVQSNNTVAITPAISQPMNVPQATVNNQSALSAYSVDSIDVDEFFSV